MSNTSVFNTTTTPDMDFDSMDDYTMDQSFVYMHQTALNSITRDNDDDGDCDAEAEDEQETSYVHQCIKTYIIESGALMCSRMTHTELDALIRMFQSDELSDLCVVTSVINAWVAGVLQVFGISVNITHLMVRIRYWSAKHTEGVPADTVDYFEKCVHRLEKQVYAREMQVLVPFFTSVRTTIFLLREYQSLLDEYMKQHYIHLLLYDFIETKLLAIQEDMNSIESVYDYTTSTAKGPLARILSAPESNKYNISKKAFEHMIRVDLPMRLDYYKKLNTETYEYLTQIEMRMRSEDDELDATHKQEQDEFLSSPHMGGSTALDADSTTPYDDDDERSPSPLMLPPSVHQQQQQQQAPDTHTTILINF